MAEQQATPATPNATAGSMAAESAKQTASVLASATTATATGIVGGTRYLLGTGTGICLAMSMFMVAYSSMYFGMATGSNPLAGKVGWFAKENFYILHLSITPFLYTAWVIFGYFNMLDFIGNKTGRLMRLVALSGPFFATGIMQTFKHKGLLADPSKADQMFNFTLFTASVCIITLAFWPMISITQRALHSGDRS